MQVLRHPIPEISGGFKAYVNRLDYSPQDLHWHYLLALFTDLHKAILVRTMDLD